MGPIKNQHVNGSKCGCCWSFATIAVVESINAMATGQMDVLSEQQLIDCDRSGGRRWVAWGMHSTQGSNCQTPVDLDGQQCGRNSPHPAAAYISEGCYSHGMTPVLRIIPH